MPRFLATAHRAPRATPRAAAAGHPKGWGICPRDIVAQRDRSAATLGDGVLTQRLIPSVTMFAEHRETL